MKLKLKIQQKIQLFIISSSIIIFIFAVGYISFKARQKAYKDAIELTNKRVDESAKDLKEKLNSEFSTVVALSNAFKAYKDYEKDEWQDLIHKMYLRIIKNDPNIYALWDSWELSAIDSNWDKSYGRISHSFWRDNGLVKDNVELRSLDGDSKLYAETKAILIPNINEPYFDVLTGDKTVSLLMTSLIAPIVENGKYVGVVAFDITLLQFQKIVEKIKPFEGSYAFMVSNAGVIAGHPDKDLLNTKIEKKFPEDEKKFNISEKIKSGENFSYTSIDKNGVENYISYSPIKILNTSTPWSIAISVPVKTIMQEANRNFRISILIGLLGIIFMSIIIFFISKNITNPLSKITYLLKKLSKGHIDKEMQIKMETGDEMEVMTNALNKSIIGLNKKVDFANHIGKGKLNYEFEILSNEDVLGKSLLDMRNSLVTASKEEEKRKLEDKKRRWVNEGLAKFAEILRLNNKDLSLLGDEIIRKLVNYLKANQGGLFVLNEEDSSKTVFDLLASYAYNRKKHKEKHIELGEGLIGTCAVEKETIHLTEIPDNYINITSGLGGSNPRSLLLVPLKIDNKILGVLEIASFNDFKEHEIAFVEEVAESIASTLSSVKINIRTSELLEQSQQQSEEMSAQEEEMRQNMEELQATQEEARRREDETHSILGAIDNFILKTELDFNGTIINPNALFLKTFGYEMDEINGRHINLIIPETEKEIFESIWTNIQNGNSYTKILEYINKNAESKWLITSYNPVYNEDNELIKIMFLAVDNTQSRKEKEELLKKLKK
ncbi:MAG: cache domain-containing protein [Bacteroidales bacterium]|jgi:methyl-accepting chemotaxis protein|nr:cache domain-containing protein [Bacteroidales bacterium]